MKQFWKGLLLAIWLLSQSVGIALPISHGVAARQLCGTARVQVQSASYAYDTCSQPFIVYDVAMPRVTTGVLRYRLGQEQVAGLYDAGRVSSFQIAASPRAPPVGKAQFLAAESGAANRAAFEAYKDSLRAAETAQIKAAASQAQMAEQGTIMAGTGGRVAFRDASRVAADYGGNASVL